MGVFRQIYCTFIISAMCMNLGIIFGWPSSRIKLFSSTNTTLNKPMTETEISLFGSLSSIAALVGTPLSGILLDLLGRKYSCILFSLPLVVAWTLISFIPRVDVILFSVFLSGLSGCSVMVVTIFISELCQENIRGVLTSCSNIFSGIGFMVSYLLGGYLNYDMMNYICLTSSITFLVLLSLVKETPVHLKKKGLDKEAVKSICFYRSAKPNSKIVLLEMEKLQRILNPALDDTGIVLQDNCKADYSKDDSFLNCYESKTVFRHKLELGYKGVTPEEETLKPEESLKPKPISKLQFIKNSKTTRRGFVIVLVILSLSIFQGLVVVQVYAEPLFQEILPNVSANSVSVVFALVTVVSGFTGAFLLDYFGRRPVTIYPSLAATVTSAALGAQLQLRWGPAWLTAPLIFWYCILISGSTNIVPFVILSELFLPEVRGIMTMLVIEMAWLLNFLLLFIFNPLVSAIGLGSIFYVFAVVSFLTTIFSVLYLPETKGLTVDAIQIELLKRRQC